MPPDFLNGWLKRLAEFMRAAAAMLERLSGGTSADIQLKELEARFPGAPVHWLQYIATKRTQHLTEVESRGPQAAQSPSVGEAPASDRPPQVARRAPFTPVAGGRKGRPPLLKLLNNDSQSPSPEIGFAEPRAKSSRPRLRFLSSESRTDHTATPLHPADSEPNPRFRRATTTIGHDAGPERKHPDPNPQGPRLPRVSSMPVGSEEASSKRAPSTRTDAGIVSTIDPSGRPQPASILTRFLQGFVSHKPLAARGQSKPSSTDRNDAVSRYAAETSPKIVVVAKPSALGLQRKTSAPALLNLVGAARTSPTRALALQILHPGDAGELRTTLRLHSPNAGMPEKKFDPRWPALPPVSETISDAHVEPPRFSELLREQEEGLWSA